MEKKKTEAKTAQNEKKPVKSNMNDYTDLMKKALNTPKPTKEQLEQLKKKAK